MKPTRIFLPLIFAYLLLSLSSCDAFRRLAGRPTSEDIAVIREKIRVDSIARADSEAALALQREAAAKLARDYEAGKRMIEEAGSFIRPLSQSSQIVSGKIPAKYCIVVGSFRMHANALNQMSGIDPSLNPASVMCANGLEAVFVAASDNLLETASRIPDVRKQQVCPKDFWILENDID